MQRPRVKYPHRARRFGPDRVRIGGAVYGIAAEIEDPDGCVWAMLELVDGTRSVDQVLTQLAHRFPSLSIEALRQGFDQLAATGYLEDAESGLVDFSDREQDRYSRSTSFFRWVDLRPAADSWDVQRRLRDSAVVLIGVGGTGGTAAFALAASGIGRLHLLDPDVVEISNLNRQVLFTEADIGRPKADVARDRLKALNSDIEITSEQREAGTADELAHLLDGADLLVLCGDRPEDIRSHANSACIKTGTAWVYGGYHGPQITTGAFRPGTGPCYECTRITDAQRHQGESDPQPWIGQPPVHAANAVSAGFSGNLVAHAALALLTGVPRLPVNAVCGLNLVRPDHAFVSELEQPLATCPACGGGAA